MAGDPACWSHLFSDDEGEPNMTTTAPVDRASAKVAADLTDFLSKNDDRIMQELFEFLRIPSVSAKSDHNSDTKRAAEWVKTSLDRIGLPAKISPTRRCSRPDYRRYSRPCAGWRISRSTFRARKAIFTQAVTAEPWRILQWRLPAFCRRSTMRTVISPSKGFTTKCVSGRRRSASKCARCRSTTRR